MVPQNTFSRAVQYSLALSTVVMAVITILWTGPAWAEGEKPLPTTTANSEVPVKELELLLRPLTKDDLKVEADGWLALLKEHASRLSRNKIDGMRVEGDAKAKLLAEATQLQEQQTALMDRLQAVVEELRQKGGEVDGYDKYLKGEHRAFSGGHRRHRLHIGVCPAGHAEQFCRRFDDPALSTL